MTAKSRPSVTAALEAELAGMPQQVAESTSAAMALALARDLDDPKISPTARALCAKQYSRRPSSERLPCKVPFFVTEPGG
jgi:hypothetical protein